MKNEISIEELIKLNNSNIIDIRDKTSFLDSHIQNSINIPYLDLIVNYRKKMNKEKTYYIYCDQGSKSKDVAAYLRTKGYLVINLIGGFDKYKDYKSNNL